MKPLILVKLSNCGIRDVAHKLIHSNLHNTQLFVFNNQSKSDLKLIYYGLVGLVPHGLPLGPLLFLIYINNLNFTLKIQLRLFADNTYVIVKGLNPEILQIKISSELQNFHQWCCLNKLSINVPKPTS